MQDSYVIVLNHGCTYQAELSEGSDQEKSSYILNTKQKVVRLIGQLVALYGLLLKEDPVTFDFLEVRHTAKNKNQRTCLCLILSEKGLFGHNTSYFY